MLDDIGKMIDQCRKVRSTDDLNIMVAPDSAIHLMREVLTKHNSKITYTDDPDELFIYDGVPIRLRICAQPGIASLCRVSDFPERSCCDKTAMTVMAIGISKARA